MKTSNEGLAEICAREGGALTKYLDSVGVHTIGIGATVSEISDLRAWPWTKELSLQEIFNLFKESIVKYENAVIKALKVPVSQHKFDALVSITYNIGTGGMANSTFMKRINAGASDASVRQAILFWTKPKELLRRRTQEADLYTKGVYTSGGKMNLFPVSASSHKPIYAKGRNINSLDYL